MHTTRAQLEAVVTAASDLLGARQDQAVTHDEWIDLAKAVAACTGGNHLDLLTDHERESIAG